jgi:hypothetical protein
MKGVCYPISFYSRAKSEGKSLTERTSKNEKDENNIEERTSLTSSTVCDLNGIFAKVFIFRFNRS